jgi:hypothetical protein
MEDVCRVMFQDGSPEQRPVSSMETPRMSLIRSVTKTPAAARIKLLTEQLAAHRERIAQLEEQVTELRGERDAGAERHWEEEAVRLQSELEQQRRLTRDAVARAERAEDALCRHRVPREEPVAEADLWSPATPEENYTALLNALTVARAKEAAVTCKTPSKEVFLGLQLDDSFEDAEPPEELQRCCGVGGNMAFGHIHPLVVEAGECCRSGA